jgi:glutamate formiminotransferase/formiminotetrahydrofolate cyclodeaminase
MSYLDKSMKHFLDKLSEATPTPGGGSVAAMLGALGCGLLSMTANYTVSKKSFNGYKERARAALQKCEKLRKELMALIEKDILAYERLSRALKRNKAKPMGLDPAYKKAVAPPARICFCVHKAALIALELAYVGNESLISDVCCAIHTLDAAFESALINVKINIAHIKDKKYLVDKTQQFSELHKDIKKIKTDVLSKTKERMFG